MLQEEERVGRPAFDTIRVGVLLEPEGVIVRNASKPARPAGSTLPAGMTGEAGRARRTHLVGGACPKYS